MNHLLAFSKTDTGTSIDDLDVVPDGIVAAVGTTKFYIPAGMSIVMAYVLSGNPSRGRLIAPTFLKVGYPEVRPINGGAYSPSDPNVNVLVDRPLHFPDTDVLGMKVTDSTAASTTAYGLVLLESQREPVPPGEAFWVRYTSTTAAVANQWKTLTISMESLPEGVYIVCGMEHICTGCIAARLVFPGSPWRPGTIGMSAADDRTHDIFYRDDLGVWGRFPSFTPPTVEVLANATSNDHYGFIRVLKVGDLPTRGR